MHIRRIQPADFPATASISVDCFWDDELYNFTNPYKEQYPDHFRAHFVNRLHQRYWTPGFVFYVAVTDEGDEGHEGEEGTVAGYAVWCRYGESGDALKWRRKGLWSYLERFLLSLQDQYVFYTHADKSVDPSHLAQWLAASHDEFASIPEMWKLQNLCVSPHFQRRGIGALLMAWGKEQAQKEGVPVGLSSSSKGKGLYEKQGFRRYGTIRIKGFPVDDVPIFLWEPKGMEGRIEDKGDVEMEK